MANDHGFMEAMMCQKIVHEITKLHIHFTIFAHADSAQAWHRFSRFIRWHMPEPELLLQWDLPAVKIPGADPPCDANAEQRSICTATHSRAKEKQDRAVGMRQ